VARQEDSEWLLCRIQKHPNKKPDDWYRLNSEALVKNYGGALFSHYDGIFHLLSKVKPELGLLPWKFGQVSANFWNNLENRQTYFTWLERELKIKKPEDWYSIEASMVAEKFGSLLMSRYGGVAGIIADLRPHYQLLPWKFKLAPRGFWQDRANQKAYLDWLSTELKLTNLSKWYKLTTKSFADNFGVGLLKAYNHSVSEIISELRPDLDLKPWLFRKTNSTFWNDQKNIRCYTDWLAERLNIKSSEGWYQIQQKNFHENNGGGLISRYSYQEVLKIAYPEINWQPWRFIQIGHGYWLDQGNRLSYLAWLGKELNFTSHADWYNLEHKDLHQNFGGGLLDFYKNSRLKLLKDLFPKAKVDPSAIVNSKEKFRNISDRRAAIEALAVHLNIVSFEQWYDVMQSDFTSFGLQSLVNRYYDFSYAKALVSLFPEFPWRVELFDKRSKSQQRLAQILEQLFPGKELIYNYKAQNFRFSDSNRAMEIDIFLPELNLAVEYQGEQHFMPISYWGGEATFAQIQKRDAEKRIAITASDLTYIEIPYTTNLDSVDIERILLNRGIRVPNQGSSRLRNCRALLH
jgi:hypothetical protein